MNIKQLLLTAALVAAPFAAVAQTTTPAPAPAPKPTINQRKVDQQKRIGQGVTTGKLNASQTSHLEHQEAGINKEERGMRAQDNGHLTTQDRKAINHQQNQESRRIAHDKKK